LRRNVTLGLVITRGGGYTPRAGPMVVFQDSCISDSKRPTCRSDGDSDDRN
jgi:hypothetical protein